jgi:NADH-quinone oxidoreductase subunit N
MATPLLAAITIPTIDWTALLPILILMGGAIVVMGVAAMTSRPLRVTDSARLAMGFSIAALVCSLVLWHDVTARGGFTTIADALTIDGFSVLFMILISIAVFLTALFGEGYLRREGINATEFFVLTMLSGSGAMLLAAGGDLIVIFLGLEIMSIALYVLAGMDPRRAESGEAAMKYFVLGAFSSAIFVYGIALTYGATGSTNIAQIGAYLANNPSSTKGLLLAGAGLMLVGFGFKVAAVPFHMWTPDVYQGSPTPAVGFMAAVAKAGGFAALIRVFMQAFPTLKDTWQPLIFWVAVLTLLAGAILAVVQSDVKRMLAYSSINHAGFILLGLQAATSSGVAGSVYYLFVYAVMVIGTFGLVAVVAGRGDSDHRIESYRGLARDHRLIALALTVLLIAQAGIPFTTGFLAKFYVLSAAVSAHSYSLAVIAMISAAIAAFFYLRIVAVMYAGSFSLGRAGGPAVSVEAAGVADAGTEVAATATPGDEAAPELVGVSAAAAGAGSASGGLDGADSDVPAPGSLLAAYGDGGAELDGEAAASEAEPPEEAASAPAALRVITMSLTARVATGLCVGFTVLFGVWPQPLFDLAHSATLLF